MPNERILKKMLENGLRLQEERRNKQKEVLAGRSAIFKESDDTTVCPWTPPCFPPLF
jgi:hypothetical protein